ncbi:uncharacterized protein LOC126891922 [Diabrotica virgifera virgifera]|uniref:Uncharacterized protein n=1 Tax=Diabrotica virgifera virgifera TaxID=50390 RepID=A0ABM5L467_DIAVI|nr:uncharacterized protein LOC126891922 [Diabrotica virgifera virgifera]
MGVKIRTRRGTNNGRAGDRIAPWEKRLQRKIVSLRRDISQIAEYIRGTTRRKLIRRAEEIMRNTPRHSQHDPEKNTAEHCLDTFKQKLSVYSGRLRKYKVSNNRKCDNILFGHSEKAFYRKLNSTVENENKVYPSQEEIHEFWGNQLSTPATHNNNAGWIEDTTNNCQHYNNIPYEHFTTEEVSNTIKELHNWKSPGPDGVQNFWLKKFWSVHERLTILRGYSSDQQALNTYAFSALSYSFGIIKWSKTDVESLQRKVRTLLTKAHNHHPRSGVERTTLPRYLGGRGLMDIGTG